MGWLLDWHYWLDSAVVFALFISFFGVIALSDEDNAFRQLCCLVVLLVTLGYACYYRGVSDGKDEAMFNLARKPVPAVIHDVAVYRLKIMQAQEAGLP